MTEVVRAALDALAVQLAGEADVAVEDIVEAVIVCNPVMHHLLLGIDPVELGQAPFALATADALHLAAAEVGLGAAARRARGSICCPVSPGMSGRMRPRWPWQRRRTGPRI